MYQRMKAYTQGLTGLSFTALVCGSLSNTLVACLESRNVDLNHTHFCQCKIKSSGRNRAASSLSRKSQGGNKIYPEGRTLQSAHYIQP